MSERTQECYTRSIRKLVDFSGKTPDHISEAELENYFLHRRNVDQWAPAFFLTGPQSHILFLEFIPAYAEHGRQARIPSTRPALRLHESPSLRLHEFRL